MKDDAPVPAKVPKKRRQLEQALDRWIAVWFMRADLAPSERRRLEEEKARRKTAVADWDAGVIVSRAGRTGEQKRAVREALDAINPRSVFVIVDNLPSARDLIREVATIIAAPRSPTDPDVGELVKFARHRKLPVKVILPDGQIQEGG